MKIGILTFHRPANFGANLQAYSAYQYFKSSGYEVVVIDYTRSVDVDYKNKVNELQYFAHKEFVDTNLPLTRQVFDQEGLCSVVQEEKCDAVVIGADAVWRFPKDECVYFAHWLFENPEIVDVAVASLSPAHMGGGFVELDNETKSTIKDCLSRFKYVTVRDEWTKYVINRDIFQGNEMVKTVNPDPVITLHRYVNNIGWMSQGIKPGSYVVMTLPTEWYKSSRFQKRRQHWFKKFKNLVNESGYKLVELPLPEGKSGMQFDHIVDYPIDPLQWFLWIKNAKAFCGMRFHAIVSSISSGTPFYSIDYYGINSKKAMLLDALGLHQLARKGDTNSKIRNLLINSTFEANRTGRYIEFESPKKVFSLLTGISRESVEEFRNRLELIFDENMNALQKAITK